MNTITQITRRSQAIIEYAKKKGATAAARRYNVGRATIYRWLERYDGTLDSLKDRSHHPHSHPNQHTEEEIAPIKRMRKKNKHTGLVVFWVKLRQKGYTRSIPSLWRMLKKLELQPVKPPNPKYIPKPYENMQYLGQRVQIDVKFVTEACIVGDAKAEGRKFYQYTAIDEYSRFRYLEAFEEHSSHSSKIFLEHMLKAFKFKVECVQTDNGAEFTKRLGCSEKPTPTLFEKLLKQRGIKHKIIKPYTPRHNGKVERSHRKDNEYFYATHTFYSFDDYKKQLAVHSRKYNKSRSYMYFRKSRWDGSVESLGTESGKPHHHPNEHTIEKIKLIKEHRRRCPDLELPEVWHRLRKKGYTYCITSLYHVMKKLSMLSQKKEKKKRVAKPYEQMTHAEKRVQMDVKVVPRKCIKVHSR